MPCPMSMYDSVAPLTCAVFAIMRSGVASNGPVGRMGERGVRVGMRGHETRRAAHPRARDDLSILPAAFPQREQPEPRHVARRQPDVIGRILRHGGIAGLSLSRAIEILHA